jgi:NAD(P)H dehydrogenase (quinone)
VAVRVELLLGTFRAARRGEFAAAGRELEDLLGRPVAPLQAVLAEALER